jgi:hypothetical protein
VEVRPLDIARGAMNQERHLGCLDIV